MKWRRVSFGEYPSDEAENCTGYSSMCLDDKLGRFGVKGGGRRAETCTQRKNVIFDRQIPSKNTQKRKITVKLRPCSRKVVLVPKDDRIGTNFGGVPRGDGCEVCNACIHRSLGWILGAKTGIRQRNFVKNYQFSWSASAINRRLCTQSMT